MYLAKDSSRVHCDGQPTAVPSLPLGISEGLMDCRKFGSCNAAIVRQSVVFRHLHSRDHITSRVFIDHFQGLFNLAGTTSEYFTFSEDFYTNLVRPSKENI